MKDFSCAIDILMFQTVIVTGLVVARLENGILFSVALIIHSIIVIHHNAYIENETHSSHTHYI